MNKNTGKIIQNIIWVFAVGFLVQDVDCNTEILSKFHQHGYKIKDFRFQLMEYDHQFFNFFEIKVFKYNRTITAHNGTANLKVYAKDYLEVLAQVYKFYSNRYLYFPIRFQLNLKKTVDSNALGLGGLRNCGNFTDFYFHKDVTYHACNFVVDEAHFPPLIPDGQYKINLTLLYFNKEVARIAAFFEAYTPVAYPKK